MSGDVQPRKRKDKRRKKESLGPEEPPVLPTVAAAKESSDDFNIHVHNDHGTGGGICAKLVFFVLLSILAVLIGMIFIEKRGLTDLDTVPTESRFAQIFDGWIDESFNHHEDDHHEAAIDDHDEHDEHEESEEHAIDDEDHHGSEEEEGHDEEDEHGDEHEEEEEEEEEVEENEEEEEEAAASEEAEEQVEETEEQATEEQVSEEQEQEEDQVSEEQEETQEDVDDQEVEEAQEEEEEDDVEEEENQSVADEASNENDEQEEDNNDTNEDDADHEEDEIVNDTEEVEDDNQSAQNDDDDDVNDIFEEDVSKENEIIEEESVEEIAEEQNEDDEEVIDNTAGEEEALQEEAEKEEEAQEESTGGIKVLPDSAEESEGSDDGRWAKKESIPADYQQKMKLAESNLRDNAELSLNLYTNLMETLPNNVYVKHGRAKALDHLAEKKRSNELLQDAISSYIDLLQSQNISDEMYLDVAERCIDRIRFRGHYNRAVEVHNKIIQRFPDTPKFRNQLAVTFLTSNRLTEAKKVLQEVLSRWPNNGFAQVHYGFILKTRDNDLSAAIKYLKSGIESRETGVIDGRFYFHLGDALTRIGKNDEALKIYEDGVKHKVFLSKYQRSLYNIDRLTGRPWWSLNQTPYTWFFQLLEDKWTIIRNEGLALLNKAGFFKDEAENLRDTGEWKQFELFARGHKYTENCKKCPETCRLIENLPDAKNCRRGQVKFSVMHPGTHVWPHCGPSNCRLRAHLGLKVPPKTFIRVADETRSWSEGKVFIFDDSFEHEVWHNGTDVRLVLIIDVWHPELTAHEKRSLPAI